METKNIKLSDDKVVTVTAQQLVSKLLRKSKVLQSYLKYTKYQYNFDWNRTFKGKPEIFKFTNIDFVKAHSDGCSWFHIIFNSNGISVITRKENIDCEYYDKHIIFENEEVSLKKYLNACNPLLVISCNFSSFETIKDKQYKYLEDYDKYKFETLKNKRYEKAIELKILKFALEQAEKMPAASDLRHESIFTNHLKQAIQELIDNDKFKKYLLPIKKFTLRNTDFELDFKRNKLYVEYRLEYVYKEDGEEKTYKYGNILPTYIHFKSLMYMSTMYQVITATYLDCITSILNSFGYSISDNKIRLLANNISNNGFSKDNVKKFCKYFR